MVTRKEACAMQDHSLLGHCCPQEMIDKFAQEVLRYGFKSLCVNGANVTRAVAALKGQASVAAVVSFPQGANTTAVKVFEAVDAIRNGADEVDVVINFSRVKEKNYDYVRNEIAEVVKAVKAEKADAVTKFIIYMPYDNMNPNRLTREEIGIVGQMIIDCGGDFIKYNENHDYVIERFGDDVKAGRIRLKWSGCPDFETMLKAFDQGVTRIGHVIVPQWLDAHPEFK